MEKLKRTTSIQNCKICNTNWSSAYFSQHLKNKHNILTDEYVKIHGEFRINKLKSINTFNKSEIKLNCKECNNDILYTDVALSYHLKSVHPNLTKKEYIIKHYLNNKIPLCECGCGKKVKIMHYYGEIHRRFISGHNDNPMLGNKHSEESKNKMSITAKLRTDNAKLNNITLPMHNPEALSKRGKSYSNNLMMIKAAKFNIKITSTYQEQQNSLYKFTCLKCNNNYIQCHNSYFICRECYPRTRSKTETEILEYLQKELNIEEIIKNYRKVFNGVYEIDIFLPGYNIGIEYNGLYWHSEIGGAKGRNYHINKMKAANDKNIRLIQIFSDEWETNKDLIKSKIKHILNKNNNSKKYYARKCNILEVGNEVKKNFLIKNHIQGNDTSAIKLGCFYNNELISLMTFSKLNISKGFKNINESEYELSRFCSLNDSICVGTFSKLLNHFIKTYTPSKIITYADLCWSDKNNNVYIKNKFIFDGVTPPNYWYTNDYINRLHRFQFTKQKLVNMGHDKNLTEWEIMQSMKYDRIWDCGHLRYIWNK